MGGNTYCEEEVHNVASHDLLAFYSIKIQQETPEIANRGNIHRGGGDYCEGEVQTVASLHLLVQ